MTTRSHPYSIGDAIQHLSASDPSMGALIHAVGPYEGGLHPSDNPFEAIAEAIAYQQLSGKAAATIFGRFRALLGNGSSLDPRAVLALSPEAMRGAGLSGAKTLAIRDLAARTIDGTVPDRDTLHQLDDDEIIERLTIVRGVGPWTVKMYLMSRLGRPDVLPHTDLGIRKGVQRMDGLAELPPPRGVIERAEPWRPYRSLASWYLWRCLELDEDVMLPYPS